MTKLTDINNGKNTVGIKLTNATKKPFKISICESLDNNYCFKDLKQADIKSLHKFIDGTIGKNLTISEVDSIYLRTNGGPKQVVNGKEVIHYGKDGKSFRVFGYYNQDGYFNITRIDPKHNTNRS